jgi:hypothetical protein
MRTVVITPALAFVPRAHPPFPREQSRSQRIARPRSNRGAMRASVPRRIAAASRTVVYAMSIGFITSCAPMPSRNTATGELEYRYRPPASVKEDDRKECVAKAEDVAQSTRVAVSSTEENVTNGVAVLFGAIGALANVGYVVGKIRADREAAYEKAMRECLTEKGYSLP